MARRIETYLHSDTVTPNKGGAMVSVTAQTDFATKTPEFLNFCKQLAMLTYGMGNPYYEDVAKELPTLEALRKSLAELLKEKIEVESACIFDAEGKVLVWSKNSVTEPRGQQLCDEEPTEELRTKDRTLTIKDHTGDIGKL